MVGRQKLNGTKTDKSIRYETHQSSLTHLKVEPFILRHFDFPVFASEGAAEVDELLGCAFHHEREGGLTVPEGFIDASDDDEVPLANGVEGNLEDDLVATSHILHVDHLTRVAQHGDFRRVAADILPLRRLHR